MRKIKISEDAYLDIEIMFAYISEDNKTAARLHTLFGSFNNE
jgi:hypothetical protein